MPFVYSAKPIHILYDIQVSSDFRQHLLKKYRHANDLVGTTSGVKQTTLNDYALSLLPEPRKHVVGCAVVGHHISIRLDLKELSVIQAERYIEQVRQKLSKI